MIALALASLLAGFEPDPLIPGAPWVLRGHLDAVTAIAFSRDGAQLASVSRDKTVKVWNLKTGEVVRTLTFAQSQFSSVAFSADAQRLALGDIGFQVRVVELSTGKDLKTIAHPDAVGEVALSPDGALLAVAGLGDNGAVYELSKGAKKFEFRGRTARFSGDGKTLLISSASGSFSLLDAKTGKVKKTVTTPNELPLTTMNDSGSLIASWTAGGADVRLWNRAGKGVALLKGPVAELDRRKNRVTGVAVLPDGKRVISGYDDGVARLWNVEKREVAQIWPAGGNSAVAVSADGAWLAVAGSSVVKLWKVP